jgi:glyoxylase-like metal-dependent hydrolase (beta-lactamase superfamily II)
MQSKLHFPIEAPPAEGEAFEVAQGILWLRLPLPMALDHVNIYAIADGDGWCIVDTGMHTKRSVGIWEKILEGPLQGRPVTRVLVTHHHPDHVGMAGWLQTHHGAELLTSQIAWFYARMLTLDVQREFPPETLKFFREAGVTGELLAKRQEAGPRNFADMVHAMPQGYRRLQECQTIRIGHRTWDIRRGDGHAPEHLMLWSRDDAVVISGDQVLPGISSNVGVYVTEPEADPMEDWLASCDALQEHARDDQLVLPGHKLPFYGLPTRLKQLADGQRAVLERLVEHLETPRTATDCFPVLFRRQVGMAEHSLALGEAVAHLNHLYFRDRLTRETGPDGAFLWRKKIT